MHRRRWRLQLLSRSAWLACVVGAVGVFALATAASAPAAPGPTGSLGDTSRDAWLQAEVPPQEARAGRSLPFTSRDFGFIFIAGGGLLTLGVMFQLALRAPRPREGVPDREVVPAAKVAPAEGSIR
jgi:hypothetical protein